MIVSFIIPVFNQFDLTLNCIESLESTLPSFDYEIIIVDDHSDFDTASRLQQLKGGRIRVIQNSDNLGYARSNNIGAAQAQGRYLFLLNNDLTLQPGWFQPMLVGARKRGVGIVGNVQLNAETGEIDHAGFLFDGNGRFRHKQTANIKRRYSRFDAVTGACLAIERRDYLRVGGLDESFENGCEDIDLCFKISQLGLKILVSSKSVIKHHVSSTRGLNVIRDERNTRRLQSKWRQQIKERMIRSWPIAYLQNVREQIEPLDWRLIAEAILRLLPNKLDPSPIATLRVEAKLKRNERHWMSLIDKMPDEQIKQSYYPDKSLWSGSRFSYSGFENIRLEGKGRWIKESAFVHLNSGIFPTSIQISGTILEPEDEHEPNGRLGLRVKTNRAESKDFFPLEIGKFEIQVDGLPTVPEKDTNIELQLLGTAKSNAYAYLGRVTRKWFFLPRKLRHFWKRHRDQKLNQRLVIKRIQLDHELLLDFDQQTVSPVNFDFLRRSSNIGINLVGWFDAELGVGESARLAAKALDTTTIETNLIPLKVNCMASRQDHSLADRLTDTPSYPINVFHIDAPQSADIDHNHGAKLRQGRRNIGYWAWELPEFPDNWIPYFNYFDEIWAPSEFARCSIAMKSPLPTLTIPHCIDFDVPERAEREKFGLPSDKFLFLFAYDLNSYQPRKNPMAVIRAFRTAFSGASGRDVGLVIKTHSIERNRNAFEEIKGHLEGVENLYLIDRRLSRKDVYSLMHSVDSYVSLHRSEGFGLTVAESMYLGKPVISTDWSATAEFLDASNGCPVRYSLNELDRNHGPYPQGQIWADPDSDHAATMMQKLVSGSDYAKMLGENAAQSIRERFSPKEVGRQYEKRMKSLALW